MKAHTEPHSQSSPVPRSFAADASPIPAARDAGRWLRLDPPETGPAWLAQHAAMIACFWREGQRRGWLDTHDTLDIIDLCAGQDEASALLVSAVERRLKSGQCAGVRYLPVMLQDVQTPARIADSSEPSRDLVTGLHLRWHSAARETTLYLADDHDASLRPYRPGNPVVVIASDAWSQLPQALFAMHYGKLLRADLALLARSEPQKDDALWQPATEDDWDSRLCPLIERYRTEFNSAPIVYPAGAFRFLAAALDTASEGLLVISLAPGCTSDLALRLSSFTELSAGFRQSGRMPVNFQLLARWAGDAGGLSVERDLQGGRVLQAMLLGPVSSVPCLEAVTDCIDTALMTSRTPLSEIARAMGPGLGLDARLNLLQLSRYDPGVFLAGAEGTIRALSRAHGVDKRPWGDALEKIWEHHQCFPVGEPLEPLLAQAAMHCGYWGLARAILTERVQRSANNASDLANLGWCEARTGRLAAGISFVERALALDPAHTLANEIQRRLAVRAAARDTRWLTELRHAELPLVLEPLDESHADALCYQYRDPQIAVMTGLPAMSTPADVRQWMLDQQSDAGRVNYAVMHIDWGFVGFINLAVSGPAAFFCFWTGVDFQGRGWATAAGRLACRYAADVGVPIMLTSAYKDNHRSIRALKHLGFTELSIRACPPDQDRIFFSLIDAAAGSVDPEAELRNYYEREKLPLVFDPATTGEAAAGRFNEEQA